MNTFARNNKVLLTAGAVAAVLIAAGIAQAPAAMAATDSSSSAVVGTPVPEAEINAAIAEAQAAGAQNVDVVNPVTGEVIRSVKTPPFHTLIKQVTPGCSSTSVCIPGNPPFAFEGKGTAKLKATGRSSYRSGSWTSQVKYTIDGAPILGTITSKKNGPGDSTVFGQFVTVKQVQIF